MDTDEMHLLSIYTALKTQRQDTTELRDYIAMLDPYDPADQQRLLVAHCHAIQDQLTAHMLAVSAELNMLKRDRQHRSAGRDGRPLSPLRSARTRRPVQLAGGLCSWLRRKLRRRS